MNKKEKKPSFLPNEFPTISAILVLVLTVVCWMNFGVVLTLAVYALPIFNTPEWSGVGEYIAMHISFLMMFIALFLGSKYILKTKLSEMVSGYGKPVRYKQALAFGGVYLIFLIISSLLDFRDIRIDPAPLSEKLKYIIPVLLFTPMQACSEELFSRALPARMIFKNNFVDQRLMDKILLCIVSGVIFTLPHLANPEVTMNPEFVSAIVYYFIWGALAMALGLYLDGFEVPITIHIVNNIYTALIVNYEGGAMPTNAIFLNTSETPTNWFIIVQALLIYAILFGFAYYGKKKGLSIFKETDNG